MHAVTVARSGGGGGMHACRMEHSEQERATRLSTCGRKLHTAHTSTSGIKKFFWSLSSEDYRKRRGCEPYLHSPAFG